AVAEQQEFAVGMPAQRRGGAGNYDRCADIATHGVKRDSNLLRHERPGNPISGGPRRARPHTGKAPPKAVLGETQTLRPRRAATIAFPRPDTTSCPRCFGKRNW